MPVHHDEGRDALSVIHINVPRALKARWVRESQAQGLKLTDWIIKQLESTMQKPIIVESRTVPGRYDINRTMLIVDTADRGRMLIAQGYGGGDVEGETYRWRHGVVATLRADDTFDALDRKWNDYMPTLSAVLEGADDSRPVLAWSGRAVEALATSSVPT